MCGFHKFNLIICLFDLNYVHLVVFVITFFPFSFSLFSFGTFFVLSSLICLFDLTRLKRLILTLQLILQRLHKIDQVWETSKEFHLSSLSSLPLTLSND